MTTAVPQRNVACQASLLSHCVVHHIVGVAGHTSIMAATCSAPAPTLLQPCLCHSTSFRRRPCRKFSCNARGGSQERVRCATDRDNAPMTSKTEWQRAELKTPRHSSTPFSASATSSNLFQVLAQTALTQGFRQIRDTVDQLQQAGNKLTKGFSPRPPGYPPGTPPECLSLMPAVALHIFHGSSTCGCQYITQAV